MRDFARQIAHPKGVRLLLFFGGGFLQLATAKAPRRILTQNTPKLAVLRKDVPFRGREHKIWYLDLYFPRISAILGTIFDGTENVRLQMA